MNTNDVLRFAVPAILCLAAAVCAYYFYCLFALRKLASRGVEETADFVLGSGSALVGALQLRRELLPFLRWAGPPPAAVAEIGRAKGGT
ncbi:MAG: hypothetical protein Q8O90_04515, partial [Elusimicrobiota bacterium]|nr:hypothetical protein [Elusimicrobiota bacterium]